MSESLNRVINKIDEAEKYLDSREDLLAIYKAMKYWSRLEYNLHTIFSDWDGVRTLNLCIDKKAFDNKDIKFLHNYINFRYEGTN